MDIKNYVVKMFIDMGNVLKRRLEESMNCINLFV